MNLTDTERQILRLAADGKSAWEIANIRCRSEKTVLTQFTNINRKLGTTRLIQSVAVAIREKIIK